MTTEAAGGRLGRPQLAAVAIAGFGEIEEVLRPGEPVEDAARVQEKPLGANPGAILWVLVLRSCTESHCGARFQAGRPLQPRRSQGWSCQLPEGGTRPPWIHALPSGAVAGVRSSSTFPRPFSELAPGAKKCRQ